MQSTFEVAVTLSRTSRRRRQNFSSSSPQLDYAFACTSCWLPCTRQRQMIEEDAGLIQCDMIAMSSTSHKTWTRRRRSEQCSLITDFLIPFLSRDQGDRTVTPRSKIQSKKSNLIGQQTDAADPNRPCSDNHHQNNNNNNNNEKITVGCSLVAPTIFCSSSWK